MPPRFIKKTADLKVFCQELAKQTYVAVDTEFMRDRTYWPHFCLTQLAGPKESGLIGLVDPLAPDIDLAPLFALLCDEPVLKLFHAARQDMDLFFHISGKLPAPIFDTQLAAAVTGYGDQVSYSAIVDRLCGAKIDKSVRMTDWSKRPLPAKATAYALNDVEYLGPVYEKLAESLERQNRRHWMDEEMAVLTTPATYQTDPEEAWRRLKTTPGNPRFFHLLTRLAAWRERTAQARDMPRPRIIKDDSLIDIAAHAPRTEQEMEQTRGLPQGFARSKSGKDMLKEINAALESPAAQWPVPEKPAGRLSARQQAMLEILKLILKLKSTEYGVAARLIATAHDLDMLVRQHASSSRKKGRSEQKLLACQKGWRAEVFGDAAQKMMDGKLWIGFDPESEKITLHDGKA